MIFPLIRFGFVCFFKDAGRSPTSKHTAPDTLILGQIITVALTASSNPQVFEESLQAWKGGLCIVFKGHDKTVLISKIIQNIIFFVR